ncbi:class I SAM-dependent methyltransferase [Flavivirga jejuensis]|uniref:Class I SAM-dependent methyltransferase n=1 Tax=Flavivirga jejuensis TaxID=870487 RepID=A0ABT8WI49_9FLAO|nr:class I SAM-dependent methyltransferase [Flavivirga jejuensis]MDO5972811.1 class I SAM-dependent methyltransferase [Flavivirga jejuensis]
MDRGYYKTKESVEEYIKLAKGFNGSQLIEKLKKVLPNNSVLLEIGSGPGSDWEILKKSFNVVGSDNSAEFLSFLIAKNPNEEFLELDAITLKTDKKFDGIYSNKVMHHLRDNELTESFKRQHDILNSNGIICHSFWSGEGSEIFKGLFVNYHNKADLKKFYENSFEILHLDFYKEFDDNDSLLLIGNKK